MSQDQAETQPALETNALRPDEREGGGARRFGIRFVFPSERPLLAPASDRPMVIGREGEGEGRLPLIDAERDRRELSRRHAELRLDGAALVLRDLQSRNGVFVNGRRQSEATLRWQDVVRVGDWVGVMVASDEADEAAARPAVSLHLGPALRQTARAVQRLAATTISLILEGETGTGKERFAAAIHEWSGRKGPFVGINCAAIPEALAEAELFGHREGAFTGAHRPSAGHFRAAHGGTLFLDEVTDMPMAIQAKLLRALEQKEVLPVGDSHPVPVDVRVVAAAQIPLERAVADKRLRADLHARLDGFTARIPPLRHRREDVPSLFVHLLGRHGFSGALLSPRLVEALCSYDWPLNVREMDFLTNRLAALHPGEPVLRRSHLPERIRDWVADHPERDAAGEDRTGPTRAQLIVALEQAGGNLARAADTMGISRPKAYRLLGHESPERSKSARRRFR